MFCEGQKSKVHASKGRRHRRVHRALAIEAERAGVSLNALIAQTLAKSA